MFIGFIPSFVISSNHFLNPPTKSPQTQIWGLEVFFVQLVEDAVHPFFRIANAEVESISICNAKTDNWCCCIINGKFVVHLW